MPLGRVRWVRMPDDPKSIHLDAEQCRERAKLVRYTAEAVKSALLRQDLLEVANEYEQLAESAEVSHSE
jgi:hypothetical protein